MAKNNGVVPFAHGVQSTEVDFTKALDLSDLKDKAILITGGASGLGAGFFRAWAPHGATIVIGDTNESAGRALVREVISSTKNTNLHFIKLDVTNWQSQVDYFREASKLSPHGGIDCVVANAGISGGADTHGFENPPDYYSMDKPQPPNLNILDVNLTGVMYTTALATSYLHRNPGSQNCSVDARSRSRDRHIILVSSIAGLLGLPTQSIYSASKHAVVGLFRSLRVTAPITHGIRVNMICPYFVVTPILGIAGAAAMAGGGVAKVEDVVEAATRLVTDQSIIGRGLVVGPKVNVTEAQQVGLDIDENGKRGVWDVYADDFEHSDIFTKRVIALTNIVAGRRGWSGLLGDLGSALISPMKSLLGL
jgi:NAD(P)-dependent dehydrogenase (short-subunit alcohol dehydrogenase family)